MKKLPLWVASLITLSACQLSLPFDPITDVFPLVPTNLIRGQDVSNFWTIPDQGNPTVLVVPIEFNFSPYASPVQVMSTLNQAFNQDVNDTFTSVKEFYRQSSFEKLNLSAEITTPFQTQYHANYYANLTTIDPLTVIIDELLVFLDSTYDLSQFDMNADGVLDGLYMIYNHPATDWNSFFWAYLYQYFGNQSVDGVRVSSYVWMPYEFIVKNNQIQTETIIHETGHKLGLEDYYDYAPNDGSNNEWGLGGADMMDSNLGDHNPFSKLLLGWIEPRIVNQSMDLSLRPYASTGDAFIITDQWRGSLFDEYFVVKYFTPTGFYQGLDDYFFDGQSGLVVYHVDARLGPNTSVNYPSHFLNNNTDSPYKLIKIVEADGNNSLYLRNPKGWLWRGDVFTPGALFPGVLNSQYAWNQANRGKPGFQFRVNAETFSQDRLDISVRF